jgi:hypothetical protein
MVGGTGSLFQSVDRAEAHKWTERTWIDTASDCQIDRRFSGNRYTAWCGHGGHGATVVMLAIDASDRLSRLVGIQGQRKRGNLVEIALQR